MEAIFKLKCSIRWCGRDDLSLINVNENIGDGSWRVQICTDCADKLGLKEGDDLPETKTVERIIRR